MEVWRVMTEVWRVITEVRGDDGGMGVIIELWCWEMTGVQGDVR